MIELKDFIFREYDIRGIYPEEINEDVAYKIGRSYGSYLREKYHVDTCVVGHDNRLSSESLVKNLKKGIKDSGTNIMYYGLITTPMHYLSRKINLSWILFYSFFNDRIFIIVFLIDFDFCQSLKIYFIS